MKARITVTLKTGVLDPQGKAIEHALSALGFSGVGGVRQGKFIEVELAEKDEGKARAAQNALEHGLRSAEMHELRRLLRKHRAVLKALNAQIDMNNP